MKCLLSCVTYEPATQTAFFSMLCLPSRKLASQSSWFTWDSEGPSPKLLPTMQCHVGLYFVSKCFLMNEAMSFSTVCASTAWHQHIFDMCDGDEANHVNTGLQCRDLCGLTRAAQLTASACMSSARSTHLIVTPSFILPTGDGQACYSPGGTTSSGHGLQHAGHAVMRWASRMQLAPL